MKNIIALTSLILLSSCALYKDFQETEFNWLGSGKPRPAQVKSETKAPAVTTPSPDVQFEEMISKNWDYSKRKDMVTGITSYEAKTKSLTGDATLYLIKNDQGEKAVVVEFKNLNLNYKEGHSVAFNLDRTWSVHQVEATKKNDPKTLRFSKAAEILPLLKDKNVMELTVTVDGEGSRFSKFSVSGLQEFFTTI